MEQIDCTWEHARFDQKILLQYQFHLVLTLPMAYLLQWLTLCGCEERQVAVRNASVLHEPFVDL